MSKFLLSIAIPSAHIWEADFGMHLLFLTNYLASHPLPGFKDNGFVVNNKKGSILAGMRQKLIEQAIDHGATHVLFIDSDQTFPRDLVHRLMRHNKQVMACNIATKKLGGSPTARQWDATNPAGIPVMTDQDSHGIEQVWRVGTGVMLLNLNIFKREGLKDTKDWFPMRWSDETDSYVGEDWGFCEKLQESGVKIFIDHDVSKDIGHIGPLNYGHDLMASEDTMEIAS